MRRPAPVRAAPGAAVSFFRAPARRVRRRRRRCFEADDVVSMRLKKGGEIPYKCAINGPKMDEKIPTEHGFFPIKSIT
jgi:hypothetical protein